jgi:hypothetical protein
LELLFGIKLELLFGIKVELLFGGVYNLFEFICGLLLAIELLTIGYEFVGYVLWNVSYSVGGKKVPDMSFLNLLGNPESDFS